MSEEVKQKLREYVTEYGTKCSKNVTEEDKQKRKQYKKEYINQYNQNMPEEDKQKKKEYQKKINIKICLKTNKNIGNT